MATQAKTINIENKFTQVGPSSFNVESVLVGAWPKLAAVSDYLFQEWRKGPLGECRYVRIEHGHVHFTLANASASYVLCGQEPAGTWLMRKVRSTGGDKP